MRRTALIIVGAPVLVGVLGVLLFLAIRGDLPDPVATHWSTSSPDGFTARSRAVVPVLIGPVAGLLLGTLGGWYGRREPIALRGAAGLSTGTSVFVTAAMLGSLWRQRGLADAADAPGIGLVLVFALLVGVLLGAAAALAVPGAPAVAPVAARVDGPRLPLAPDERVVWSAWSGAPPVVVAIPMLALVPLVVMAALGIAPAFLVVVALAGLVVGSSLAARVWVDRRGLTVRAPLGFPAVTIPLDEIAAVDVIQVSALGDYGGWGWRIGRRGRPGVVFHSGDALQVTRGDGRRFVVTVDGAQEAAALLTSLTDRVRG
ncbi:MAG TPA: hypothetical protein VGP36_00985 [Mycobacteriales bacterium]|nr:hypothetical protein [Mycobacteriales bacterium]